MILVVGLGCQRGCEVHSLLALLDSALAEAGIERSRVTALASIDRKRDEPGLLALAQRLNLPLQCLSAEQLVDYEHRLSHRSALAFAHTGCYGVAESAALAWPSTCQWPRAPADHPPEKRTGHPCIGLRRLKPR